MAPKSTRSIASASVSYGGVINFPVKTHSAVVEHKADFHSFHVHEDGSTHGIEAPYICKGCKDDVRGKTERGVERGDDVVIVTKDELAAIERQAGNDYEITEFVHEDSVNAIYFDTPYRLEPNEKLSKQALDTYVLLRTVMEEQRIVGIVQYTSREKTHLAVLRVDGDVLILQQIRWPDEIREADFDTLKKPVTLNPKALKLVTQLIETDVEEFDPEKYVDTYFEGVQGVVEAKAEGRAVVVTEKKVVQDDGDDLVAKLEASIAAKAASKAAHPAGKQIGKAATAKKAAPRKAAAKTAAAKTA